MDFKSEIKVHNKFEVTVLDKDSGEVKQTAYAENIVLDAMYTQLCNFYTGIFNGIAFGTGTGTLAASRTTLFSYLGWKSCGAADCGTVEEIKTFPTMSRKRKITIQPEEYVGQTITEVGIAASTGAVTSTSTIGESSTSNFSKILTHAILDTPIVKTATDIVVIEATLYFSFGEWETGFYNGNVRWRPAAVNDLVNYLFGVAVMPSVYFKVGTNPFFSNNIAEGLLATSSAIANTGWTKDVANKKITTPVSRFAASAGNGAIKTFGLGASDTSGIFTAVLPLTGVFENHAITGEAVGAGDGVTAGFDLDWDDIDAVSAVYLDGVETTAYTLEEKRNIELITKLGNPSTLPAGNGRGAAFSPDGTYLVIAHASSPYITIYKRNGDIFTKLGNPAVLPKGVGYKSAFSSDGTYLAVAHDSSPYITIYKRNGDVFTKLDNPAVLPTGVGNHLAFSPDGTYLAIAHSTSPYITIYKRNGDAFTKLDNPATLPAGSGRGVAFSPDGTYLAIAHNTSPYITIYKRNGDVFTKLDNPAVLPTGCQGVAFSPDGAYLALNWNGNPNTAIYKRNGDVFTKLDNPAVLPTGAGYCPAFSPNGTYLVIAHEDSPYITIYKRNGDVFTKLDNPATLPTTGAGDAVFLSDGTYLALAHYSSPYISIYKMDYATPSQAHNIEFTTAPAAGVVITADYTIDYIPKDANHVLDLSATIQWG